MSAAADRVRSTQLQENLVWFGRSAEHTSSVVSSDVLLFFSRNRTIKTRGLCIVTYAADEHVINKRHCSYAKPPYFFKSSCYLFKTLITLTHTNQKECTNFPLKTASRCESLLVGQLMFPCAHDASFCTWKLSASSSARCCASIQRNTAELLDASDWRAESRANRDSAALPEPREPEPARRWKGGGRSCSDPPESEPAESPALCSSRPRGRRCRWLRGWGGVRNTHVIRGVDTGRMCVGVVRHRASAVKPKRVTMTGDKVCTSKMAYGAGGNVG